MKAEPEFMEDSRQETVSLVREKRQIEEKLSAAGGKDFSFLLQDCADLLDMIEEIRDVSSKRGKKEHAAFESKIKFSRKVRRKAKDLGIFEQRLVQEYDSKHISLEHGRKMAAIIKLLRSNSVEKAERGAAEFCELHEMGARLGIVSDLLSKKRTQAERARRSASERLADIEWLEKEPPLDTGRIGRQEERMRLLGGLEKTRLGFIQSLRSMPLALLLEKARADGLGKCGFPEIPAHEAEALSAYLRKSGLEQKSCGQLLEMTGLSEQKLGHLGIELAGFRKEIAGRQAYFAGIMSLHASRFLALEPGASQALAYLSGHSEEAKKAAARLEELGRTADDDGREWARKLQIEQKKAALAGAEKSVLIATLQELDEIEGILDGKAAVAPEQKKEKRGVLKSILEIFESK